MIGVGGGSDPEDGEGVSGDKEEEHNDAKSPDMLDSNRVAPSADGADETKDGAVQSEDRPSQTVEGLFGDAADLSSS